MDVDGKPSSVVDEEPSAKVDEVEDAPPEADVHPEAPVAAPEDVELASDAHHVTENVVSGSSGDGLGSEADLSEAHLAAPGHSPSFAYLGDTSGFESRHAPNYSDTFEGFETPRLSNSQEIQETPKVTRPEGLSFTTPMPAEPIPERIPVISETPESAGPVGGSEVASTPELSKDQGVDGTENTETEEDFTSPIANLVEKPRADGVLESAKASRGGSSLDSFSFRGDSPREPRVIERKIPGHELLSSYMGMAKAAMPGPQEGSKDSQTLSQPMAEKSIVAPIDDSVSLAQKKAPGESESVLLQPRAVEGTEPEPHETPKTEDPTTATALAEKSDGTPKMDATDSLSTAPEEGASTMQKTFEATDLRPLDEGVAEEVAEKSNRVETEPVGRDEVVSPLPQSQSAKLPETFSFWPSESKEEATSSATVPLKPVPFLRKLTTMSTKKLRGPSDSDLKKMVMIPEYLGKDMANAVETKGAANPKGPLPGVKFEAPSCPLIVFINSKSGGRLGPDLLEHFKELISPNQVYDIPTTVQPRTVLWYGVGCLDRLANLGDECARQTRENLRIIVAGGDGTVGWVLSCVKDLRVLSPNGIVPPVGVIPLGTGNDLSRSFGWGGEFPSASKASLKRCLIKGGEFSSTSKSSLKRSLIKAMGANTAPLDTWQAVVIPAKSVAREDIKFPHAMQPQQHVPLPTTVAGDMHEKDEKDPAFEGLFFNYFSIGMDAQVAYGFHHLRDEKPWLARGRVANQLIYSSFGCTQGWFCTACSVTPHARGVGNIAKLFVKKRGSTSKGWEEVHIPNNIRAIVILNLHNYAGGRNPWGHPSAATRLREGLEEQKPDDGLVEIMGLTNGWHSAFVLLAVRTAVRLCQAEAVRLELSGNARKKAYLQMDGEPWLQPLGINDPTIMTIEKLPAPSMLLKR